jgi:hypothetical protein
MQGPVGIRCRRCGTPPRDPLTVLSRRQLAAGIAVALGAGTVAGFVGLRIGFLFSLCIGPFIGGLIGEGVMRATGYKRGLMVRLLVLAGIILGVLLAATLDALLLLYLAAPDAFLLVGIGPLIVSSSLSGVVYIAAASFGAFARLR